MIKKLILKFVGPTKQHINADIKLIKNIVNKYTKYPFKFSKNGSDRERLWKVRKMTFWADYRCSNFNKSLISYVKTNWINHG